MQTATGSNEAAAHVGATAQPGAPAPLHRPSLAGARLFVALVYLVLASGFVASVWLLFVEFRDQAPLLAVAHSHLFIFFPTFGLLALLAFYLPSVVFTHLYWHHLPYGRVRFLLGFAVALGLAGWVSTSQLGEAASPRAVWELAPKTLAADRGDCAAGPASCARLPILSGLETLRTGAQQTASLSKFGRSCVFDRLLEVPEEHRHERHCFAAGRKLNTEDCCKAQASYARAVETRFRAPAASGVTGQRSNLALHDKWLQPMKSFFIVVVLVIGGMLVVWQNRVRQHYPNLRYRMERHVFVGAMAMLLWPVMDYAYLDTSNALFGRWTNDLQARLSLVAAPWAMLLLFYYLQRFARRVEVIGQIITVGGTLLAIVARDELKDWAVRGVGIGMPWWMGVVLATVWLAGVIAVLAPERWMPPPPEPR